MPIDHFQAQRFGRLELLAKQAVEGFITGLHKSPYHGFSVEFAEHRAYNTGESTRHIDWKLYGRTDKMFVKRYEEETNLRCQIVIDHSSSMFYPDTSSGGINKFQFAVQSAAALIYLLRNQRDAVGISLIGDGVEWSTPSKSSSTHHTYLFNELEKKYDSSDGSKSSKLVDSLHDLADQVHKRSLIVVFSDFLDSGFGSSEDQTKLFRALQHLRYNKHEVVLFQLFDQATELEFDLENRPYILEDLETGEQLKLMPEEVREKYSELRHKRIADLKLRCREFHIDWNECAIEDGVMKVLDRFLAKRSKLM